MSIKAFRFARFGLPVLIGAFLSFPYAGQAQVNTLASFQYPNTQYPFGLVASSSTLYGTTGGAGIIGEIFSLPITGGTPAVLTSFNGANGMNPSNLILYGSTIYGTVTSGTGYAEIFSISTSGGSPNVLYTFNTPDAHSLGGLAISPDGSTLYGTTAAQDGQVFSISSAGGSPTTLATFNGTNGSYPGFLTVSADGSTLYGTTQSGPSSSQGQVYSLSTKGGSPVNLTSFNGTDGSEPSSPLVISSDGTTLYGTTFTGGPVNDGEVFSIPITGGTPSFVGYFNGSSGEDPQGALILSGNALYGVDGGGASGFGLVYSVPASGGTPIIAGSFTGTNGKDPSDLILSGKVLYGMTGSGGKYGQGTVFSINLPEPAFVPLVVLVVLGLARRPRRSFLPVL